MSKQVSSWLKSVVLSVAVASAAIVGASAQDNYPSRPVTMIIAAAPGGGTDIIARIVGKQLETQLGQPVIMENRPGGASVVAADFVARQAPDGYTLLMTFDGHIIGAATTPNLNFDPVKSFTPVSQVASTEIVLTVREDSPAKDMKSFLEWAKGYKGNLNGGIPAPNSPFAPAAKSFVDLAGLDAELINNVGSNKTILGLLGGEYQFAFTSLSTALPHIKEGKLRAIGVASPKASEMLPDVAPIADTFPGYQFQVWFGIMAPAGLPQDILTRLADEAAKSVNEPSVKKALDASGSIPVGNKPAEFKAMLEADMKTWSEFAKTAPK